jgi:flagellar secretion chaperone FliS
MTLAHHAVYQTVQATTADPARITLLLFDGAARFLRQAEAGLERKDPAAFTYPLARAQAIIVELAMALDHERGGEVATNLGRLYDFMLRHLTEGLMTRSRDHVARVLTLLQEVRAGFEGAVGAEGSHAA